MKAEKITPIGLQSPRQRLFRYTLTGLNVAALLVTIMVVTWILGRMIAALHALVFSLVLPATPDLSRNHFPILEGFNARGEVYSILKDPDQPFDGKTVYTVDRENWSQRRN
jgi:hypothetical protein